MAYKWMALWAVCAAVGVQVSGQTVKRVCATGCDYGLAQLQQAVDDAQPGWVIEIAAGQTVSRTFALLMRDKGDTAGKYITIRSSGVTNLTPGQRVTPADAPNLAKLILVSRSDSGLLSGDQRSAFYRFEGIEFTLVPGLEVFNLLQFSTINSVGSVGEHDQGQLIHDIVFDQCYIHGLETGNSPRRAVMANTGALTITNSWISDIHSNETESSAIGGWNGPGPFYIRNNHLSASGITTLFGGAPPAIAGLRATDVMMLSNHYYRPWSWRSTSGAVDPGGTCLYDANGGEYYKNTASNQFWRCVSGTWTSIAESAFSIGFLNKNQFELKNASKVWVEGNVIENAWLPSFQGQHGAAFLMNQVDNSEGNGEPTAVVEYVSIRNNVARHTPWGISTGQIGNYYQKMHDVAYENNLFDDLGIEPESLNDSQMLQTTNNGRLRFSQNTVISNRSKGGILIGMDAAISDQIEFTGNIVGFNEGGFRNSVTGGGNLWNAVDGVWSLNRAFSKNVVVNNQHSLYTNVAYPIKNIQTASDVTGLVPCASCSFPEYFENGGTNDVGFANFAAKDYHLKPTSKYLNWSHMGQPAGADMSVLNWSTEQAVTGQVNPYLDFVIRRVAPARTSLELSYSALNTSACTVTVSGRPDLASPVSVQTDTAGDLARVINVPGLTPNTRYFYRITCGLDGHRRDGIVLTLR